MTVLRPAAADSHTQQGTTPELELAGGQGQGRGVSGRGVDEAQGCRGRCHVVCRAAAGVLQGLDRTAGLRGLPVAPCPWPPRMGRRLCSLQITTSIHSSRRATGDQPNYQHLTISECWSFFGIPTVAHGWPTDWLHLFDFGPVATPAFVHFCTPSLCYLGSEMIITEIKIQLQRSSSGQLTPPACAFIYN